jgi:hypothetical protein
MAVGLSNVPIWSSLIFAVSVPLPAVLDGAAEGGVVAPVAVDPLVAPAVPALVDGEETRGAVVAGDPVVADDPEQLARTAALSPSATAEATRGGRRSGRRCLVTG